MDGALEQIELLIAKGEELTYKNFAMFDPDGQWPRSYSPAWLSWTTRVSGAIRSIFGDTSAPMRIVKAGHSAMLLGNGSDKFENAKSYFLGALISAKEVLGGDTFGEILKVEAGAPLNVSNRVFVVHGHDDLAKTELENVLREFGLEPIVLHRQADEGRTLIEKFEHYSDVGFAFVMLTPDEVAYLVADIDKPDEERSKEYRARANAIFEFGFFVGKLGRSRTCCLYKSPVTIPTDLNGLVYKKFNNSIEEVAYPIQKELKAAGYTLV